MAVTEPLQPLAEHPRAVITAFLNPIRAVRKEEEEEGLIKDLKGRRAISFVDHRLSTFVDLRIWRVVEEQEEEEEGGGGGYFEI